MSLINGSGRDKGRTRTLAQSQAVTKQTMQRSMNDLFRHMVAVYQDNYRMIYNNPYGLTSDEAMAGFGQDVVELVRLATLLHDVINLIEPGTLPPPVDEYGSK